MYCHFVNLRIVLFVVLLLILPGFLPSHALATTVDPFTIAPNGTSPLVAGNTVFFNSSGDIYAYDLRTKETSVVIQKPGLQYVTGVWRDFVVYEDVDETTQDYDIRLFERRRGRDVLISGDPNVSETNGATNGREVVYIRGGACGSLNSFSIIKRKSTQIAPSVCSPVRIWQENVVFPVNDPGGTNIQGYNFRTKSLFDVTTESNFQEVPNIYNDTVIWLDRTTGTYGDPHKIVTKNLRTGEIKLIYESTDALNWPAISRRYAVWSQSSAPNIGGLRGADLRTGEIFEIQPQYPVQNSTLTPAIWTNVLAWSNGGVYGAKIVQSSPTPTPTLVPTSTPTPTPTPSVFVFNDDFNDGNADGWWLGYALKDHLWGNWRVENGILVQDTGDDGVLDLIENHQFSSQVTETRLKLNGPSGGGGIAVWFRDDNNGVYFSVANETLGVGEVNNGVWSNFNFPVNFNINENRWVDLKLVADSVSGDIEAFMDGTYLFTYHAITMDRTGKTGYISGNAGGYFDDFRLTATEY